MIILVTGFDPFGGESINPAYEAVKRLPEEIKGNQIIKLEIPTVYGESAKVVEEAIKKHKPDVVLSVGQAGGRSNLTVEKVAINLAEARIKDNAGKQPMDQPLKKDGETAYFTTLPIKAMVNRMRANKIPANISYTAGTFVCNDIMYQVLYLLDKKYEGIRGGFIHVPFLPEQVVNKPDGVASMPMETIAKGIEHAIEAIIDTKEDETGIMGTIM